MTCEKILSVTSSYETDIYGNKCLFYTLKTDNKMGNNVHHCSIHSFCNDKKPMVGKYVKYEPNGDLLRKWKVLDTMIR